MTARYAIEDYPGLLWRERGLMIVIFLVVLAVGVGFAFTLKTVYPAQSSLLVRLGPEYVYQPRVGDAARGAIPEADQVIQSEVEILSSAQVREQVVARIGIAKLFPKLGERYAGASPAEKRELTGKAVTAMGKALKIATTPGVDLESDRVALVAKIGENIQVRRQARLEVQGNGLVAAYIHTGGKVGVLVEVGAGKEGTSATEEFKQLVRDITLQIAAAHPTVVSRENVPADLIQKEREIAAQSDALKGKPAAAMENILKGKLEKYYQTICLIEQGFVKNPDLSVQAHVASVGKTLGDEITVRGFVRFQVGEAVA